MAVKCLIVPSIPAFIYIADTFDRIHTLRVKKTLIHISNPENFICKTGGIAHTLHMIYLLVIKDGILNNQRRTSPGNKTILQYIMQLFTGTKGFYLCILNRTGFRISIQRYYQQYYTEKCDSQALHILTI